MRGFTLIELIMVIVIIGIISIVVIPRLNLSDFQNTEVRSELIQGIRYAQSQSIYHTGANAYEITVGTHGFQVTQSGVAIPDPSDRSSNYVRNWPDATIAPTGTISFNGRGSPTCSPAALCNGTDINFTVTISGSASNVTMEQFTGFAH